MKNEAHGIATLHLIKFTDMNEDTFSAKFHQDNIVDVKIKITLSDGSEHLVDAFLEGLGWIEYLMYKQEKATKYNDLATA